MSIKKVVNKGLSPELEKAFPEITALAAQVRPLVQDPQIPNPNWLAGFVSAEGSFMISLKKSNSKTGIPLVLLCFQVTQHQRDERLMLSLIEYFNCGNTSKIGKVLNF